MDNNEYEALTPRERISLAKLISDAPADRLPAIKAIVQPLIPEDLDMLLPVALPYDTTAEIDLDELIECAYNTAELYGHDDGDKWFLEPEIFDRAFVNVGKLTARRLLCKCGVLVRSESAVRNGSYTDSKRWNGKPRKFIFILKRPTDERKAAE